MNLREIALRILCEYEAGGKYVNLALSSHLTDRLSVEEKAALTALLYTTVERKMSYDYYILSLSKRSDSDLDPYTKNILRLGVCQILDMSSVPEFAAVNETVKLCRNPGERSFVNGVLRAVARAKDNLPMPDEAKNYKRYISVKYSFPLWIVKLLDSRYGREATEQILDFYNNEKYTDITVNTVKISVDEYKEKLEKCGFETETNPYAPFSLRIPSSVNPERLVGFSDGEIFVQDRASAISAALLSAKPGETVVDVCAAPGGKSFASAISAGDKGKIYSFDLHESKISLISSGAERLSLASITADSRDATTPDASLIGKADKVICDVPCSGIGVLGKKPDLRYKDGEAVKSLPSLQLQILSASSTYLKSGGELIYSTCTLCEDENEQVVREFLSQNPDFSLLPIRLGDIYSEDGMLTLLPHIHRTDGFFIARLKKG